MTDRPMIVTINGEKFVAERILIAALAAIYNSDAPIHSVAVADACDSIIDPGGAVLGRVRHAAAEARDAR